MSKTADFESRAVLTSLPHAVRFLFSSFRHRFPSSVGRSLRKAKLFGGVGGGRAVGIPEGETARAQRPHDVPADDAVGPH
jgi:hypothetical protein